MYFLAISPVDSEDHARRGIVKNSEVRGDGMIRRGEFQG